MNAICTIVAKNYLAAAKTLGDSIKKSNPDMEFHILLSDEFDGYIKTEEENYSILEARSLNIPNFDEMAYKYNVIEFSTAVKPFYFEYLFDKYNYDKLYYLDPDMYVYKDMCELNYLLDKYSILLTPHLVEASCKEDGLMFEKETLGGGMYNLGFLGMKNDDITKQMLIWWQTKLKDNCYFSKREYLFYDQKWMNFVPIIFKNVYIIKSKAYNIARWNFHERLVRINEDGYFQVEQDGKYTDIVIFHYSGFKVNIESFGVGDISISDEQKNNYWKMFCYYKNKIENNHVEKYSKMPYKYDYFENGYVILQFYRRLFRRELMKGYHYDNPFGNDEKSFYQVLNKNGLLIEEKDVRKANVANSKKMTGFYKKLGYMDKLMSIVKKLVGNKIYILMVKYFNNYFYEERQEFLIKKR